MPKRHVVHALKKRLVKCGFRATSGAENMVKTFQNEQIPLNKFWQILAVEEMRVARIHRRRGPGSVASVARIRLSASWVH